MCVPKGKYYNWFENKSFVYYHYPNTIKEWIVCKQLRHFLFVFLGLGPWGLAVIYGSLIVSCMFLPTVIIWRLGCKWTIVASMACYILYMVANFYAKWGTMMPSSVIVGLGAAPLWSAKCAYLTETGIHYAKMMGETSDAVVNRFFGVFFAFFQTSK